MLGWYLEGLFDIAVMTAVVYAIGRALLRATSVGSEARRVHGRYVLWWCVGGYFVCGAGSVFLAGGADTHLGVAAAASFGLLVGWAIGTAHGLLVLAVRWWRGRVVPSGASPEGASVNRLG